MLCDYCARREPESLMFRALAGAARTESVDQVERALRSPADASGGGTRNCDLYRMRGGSDAFNMMQKQTVAVAAPQETDYSLIYAPSPLFPHSREFGLVVLDSDFEKTKDFLTSDLDRRKC